MVTLSIQDGKLIGEIDGWHKFWACKSRLEIPLEHISGVAARPDEAKEWWHGWKIIGTDVPGEFAAGLFKTGGKWVFWDVRNPENTIAVQLHDERYQELLIEVENPDAMVKFIADAIKP